MKNSTFDLKSRQKSSFPYPVDAFALIAAPLGKTPAQAAILRRTQVVADDSVPFYDPYGADYSSEVQLLTKAIEQWGKAEWSRVAVEDSTVMAARLDAIKQPGLAQLFRDRGAPAPTANQDSTNVVSFTARPK